MSFDQFLEAHPELAGESKDEQLNAYDLYLSSLADSIDDWVLG
jgi:hypothetical protein